MHVILFDGMCNVCDRMVNFIVKRDKENLFRFAPLQTGSGKLLADIYHVSVNKMDTVIYIRDSECFRKSTAVLKILGDLGGYWKLWLLFLVVPTCIRDLIYDSISYYRYRIFGKKHALLIPSKQLRSKYID